MRDFSHLVLVLCLLTVAGCGSQYVDDPARETASASSRHVWLAVRPSQCSPNEPWHKDWIESHGGAPYPRRAEEMSNIVNFCSKQGIRVIDSLYRYEHDEPLPACAMCDCPGSYVAYLLVDEKDAPTVASFGFRPKRPY